MDTKIEFWVFRSIVKSFMPSNIVLAQQEYVDATYMIKDGFTTFAFKSDLHKELVSEL